MNRAQIQRCFNGSRAAFEIETRKSNGRVFKFHPSISQGGREDADSVIGFRIEFQVTMRGSGGPSPMKKIWREIHGDDVEAAARSAVDTAVSVMKSLRA